MSSNSENSPGKVQSIVIVNYGAGNIQSIKFALQRLGYTAELSKDPAIIQAATKVIFPGVGEASSAMKKLKETGLDTLIPQLKQPVLGICLGMQLMCNSTEEGNTQGLGIFDTDVIHFGKEVKVPQIGWNQIENLRGLLFNGVSEKEYIYLVHSYYAPIIENTIATSNYGGDYSIALQKDNFCATQFHPEKSSSAGEQILRNFLSINTTT